jgi:hypothetical protein
MLVILINYRVRAGTRFFGLELFTRSLSYFSKLNYLFYPNGIKVIPYNLYKLLTPLALAHMIMVDGSAKSYDLILCTNSYSIQDIILLMNVLLIHYRLECSIHFKR